jgi:hypothetical protein
VKEFWEVMVMDLVRETVFRSDEYVFEETFFILRDVDKPAGFVSTRFALKDRLVERTDTW